jgi:endogenous inhibitor of DNA gyrase (YacG/DUF329 family)
MPRVRCPTCRREVEWSATAEFRPFCSERCKLVDLGAWFSGERAIPADAPPDEALPDDLRGDDATRD